MKVLLDENIPQTIANAFDRFATTHVNEMGWQGKQNGELLVAARAAGFTVLVTTDVNLYNQQKARLH
jgi:predicted nuclease of predicted toxin-antitoxin system